MALAFFRGKRLDVTISGGLVTPAELLRLNSLCPAVSAGFGVRNSESVIVKSVSTVDRKIFQWERRVASDR